MAITSTSFGVLLRTLRKRVGMTQGDLAAAVGYSVAAISALEQERRLPLVEFVVQQLVPALALADAPQLATRLVELAVATRGERPPTSITVQRAAQVVIQEELIEQPNRLPILPTTLIGRTTQVNQLCDRLLGHGGRLLTLVGPPGIGKTTLALAVAAQVQPHYGDGAVFVPLAAISEPTLMASTIASAVGCSDAGPKPPQTRLTEFLRRKTMLLVLDNLEQIVEAAPLIAELIAECPGVCVLATSRERLHLRAEQRFKVPALDLAPAVELFVRRAQAVDADFVLTPQNRPTLEAICQRLDCLPLAIELCAVQIGTYATRLIEHGEFVRGEPLIMESLARFQTRGNQRGIADCLGTLGRLALLQGEIAKAHTLFQQVVTKATTFCYHLILCEWQPRLGIVTLYRGDTMEARRLLSESLRLCLELKNKFFLARVCVYLAETALWEGALDQTQHWLTQSLAYHANPRSISFFQVERVWETARLATATQHYRRAAMLFGLADQMHSQLHYAIAGPMRSLAYVALVTVQTALEPGVFAEAFVAGQQLTLEEAFATLLPPMPGENTTD